MERDIIMREVRQLAAALARALLHRQMKQYDEAVDEIDRSIARVGLVAPDRLILFSKVELEDHLTLSGVLDSEYGFSLSLLLRERAYGLIEIAERDRALESLRTARSILELIRDSDSTIIPHDLLPKIDSLTVAIDEIQS